MVYSISDRVGLVPLIPVLDPDGTASLPPYQTVSTPLQVKSEGRTLPFF